MPQVALKVVCIHAVSMVTEMWNGLCHHSHHPDLVALADVPAASLLEGLVRDVLGSLLQGVHVGLWKALKVAVHPPNGKRDCLCGSVLQGVFGEVVRNRGPPLFTLKGGGQRGEGRGGEGRGGRAEGGKGTSFMQNASKVQLQL